MQYPSSTGDGSLVVAPAFMRGKERFSAPGNSLDSICALALAMLGLCCTGFTGCGTLALYQSSTGFADPRGMKLGLKDAGARGFVSGHDFSRAVTA